MKRPFLALLASLCTLSCDEAVPTKSPAQVDTSGSSQLKVQLLAPLASGQAQVDSIRMRLALLSPDSTLLDTTVPTAAFDSFRLDLPSKTPFHLRADGLKSGENGTSHLLWTGELVDTSGTASGSQVASILVTNRSVDLIAPSIQPLSRDTILQFADSNCILSWRVTDDSLLLVTGNGIKLSDSAGTHRMGYHVPPSTSIWAILQAIDKAGNLAIDSIRITRGPAPEFPRSATPSFSLISGSADGSLLAQIRSTTPEAHIHVTFDEATPTCMDSLYTAPIEVATANQVNAIACAPGYLPSQINSLQIGFAAAAPTFSARSGLYTSSQELTLSASTPGGLIHYTNDGTDPTCTSLRYVTPLKVDSSQKIKAIVCRDGWTPSAIDSAHFTLALPALSFSPDSGIYDGAVLASLTNAVPGSSILYTTDSTTPTNPPSGTTQVYTGPIRLGRSATIQAIAVRQGWISSPLSSRSYIPLGDTIPLAEFESGEAVTLWGKPFEPFGCASGTNAAGTPGCNITKRSSQLAVSTRIGDPAILGKHAARMDFDLHASSTTLGADPFNGPGYSGIYADVPGSFMSKAVRMNFWARFEPAPGNMASTAPLMVEYPHSNLDNMNTGYVDAFQRIIVPLDTTWRQYSIFLSNFWYPMEAIRKIADSTSSFPKTPSWILPDNYGSVSSSTLNSLGLSKWWGPVIHSYSQITWLHNVNRDVGFAKSSIRKFRWSVLQPSSEPLAQETNPVAGLSSSFRGALLLDRVQIERAPF